MKVRIVIGIGAAAILLAGCATTSTQNLYPGPERAPGQVATVIVPWQIQIRSVNGQSVAPSLFGGSEKESMIRVLPGAQEWQVRYYDPFADDRRDRHPQAVDRTGILSLRFEARAGVLYRLAFETPEQNPSLRDAEQKVRLFLTTEAGQDVSQPAVGHVDEPWVPEPVPLEQATLEQLKSWWRAAGANERQAFMEWVNEEQ